MKQTAILLTLLIIAAIGYSMLRQHYYCGTPWGRCDPLQLVPCEPVAHVEADEARYKQLAKEYN